MESRLRIGAKGLLLAAAACVALSGAALARELSVEELGVEELAELERLLATLNFDPGQIDGVVDARTRTAVGLYQEFAALPVDGTPSAKLLAELRQVVQAFADMKAAQATAQAEAAPPAVLETAPAEPEPETEVAETPPPEPEPEPEVAETPPAEPEPEPAAEAAETPPAEPEPEVAEAPQPAEPEPEAAEAQPAEPEPEVAEAQPAEPEPEATPEPEAPAASETQEAEAPASEETKSRFDLDNMIARLVQPDWGADTVAGNRANLSLVIAVQRHLARIGLDPGPLDGQVGAQTMRAVEAYQRARGLPVDGRPTRDLLTRLEREPAGPAAPAQVPPGGEAARDGAGSPAPRAGDGMGERASQAAPALKFPASSGPAADGYDAFKKGYAAVLAGDFDLAIEFYTHAIEGGDLALTHLADAFYNRANARFHKGALEFAIADYGSAIVNKPEFPGAYYNRGFALEAIGQHTRALANFMRARALGLRRLGVRSPDILPPRP